MLMGLLRLSWLLIPMPTTFSGTAKANLARARLAIERVLVFRGSVTGVKAKGMKLKTAFWLVLCATVPRVTNSRMRSSREWVL
jgi:hypothetical protein